MDIAEGEPEYLLPSDLPMGYPHWGMERTSQQIAVLYNVFHCLCGNLKSDNSHKAGGCFIFIKDDIHLSSLIDKEVRLLSVRWKRKGKSFKRFGEIIIP